MLKFIENKKATMSLIFSQVGIIIVTGILFSAVVSVFFLNDWYKKAEIENIASRFSTIIEEMDARFFEDVKVFYFPDKSYNYNVSLSTEYITVNWPGTFLNILSIKRRFFKKPLLICDCNEWKTGEDFHYFLNDTYGCFGNETNPIMSMDVDSVKNEIKNIFNQSTFSFSMNPLYLDLKKPVYIEQVFVFYDLNDDNRWDKDHDEKQSFVLVYQI
jgi:hypothetical protein